MPIEPSSTKNSELEQVLLEVERSLDQLQVRHAQVKRDIIKLAELQQRQQELKQDQSKQEPIKTELRHLQAELERLDLSLESSLLPDIFWQVIRFVFLGIVIGWLLNSWAS